MQHSQRLCKRDLITCFRNVIYLGHLAKNSGELLEDASSAKLITSLKLSLYTIMTFKSATDGSGFNSNKFSAKKT